MDKEADRQDEYCVDEKIHQRTFPMLIRHRLSNWPKVDVPGPVLLN